MFKVVAVTATGRQVRGNRIDDPYRAVKVVRRWRRLTLDVAVYERAGDAGWKRTPVLETWNDRDIRGGLRAPYRVARSVCAPHHAPDCAVGPRRDGARPNRTCLLPGGISFLPRVGWRAEHAADAADTQLGQNQVPDTADDGADAGRDVPAQDDDPLPRAVLRDHIAAQDPMDGAQALGRDVRDEVPAAVHTEPGGDLPDGLRRGAVGAHHHFKRVAPLRVGDGDAVHVSDSKLVQAGQIHRPLHFASLAPAAIPAAASLDATPIR